MKLKEEFDMEFFKFMLCGILFIIAVSIILLTSYVYKKREIFPRYFLYFCMAVAIYCMGYAFELINQKMQVILFWNYVQYLGIPFIPTFWLLFSLEYTKGNVSKYLCRGAVLFSFITMVMRFTGSMHYLYYQSVTLTKAFDCSLLTIEKGPWYWIHVCFVTFCLSVANNSYIKLYRCSNKILRKQAVIMIIASILLWISVLCNLLNLIPISIDVAPFVFALSIPMLLFAFWRYRFLDRYYLCY